MAKTVVGLFNTTAEAEHVKSHLISEEGYEAANIHIVANEDGGETASSGVGGKIAHFFSSLTGGDNDAHEHYSSGVNSGGALLTVAVPDEDAAEVALLLKQHGARDIDGNEQAATSGTPVYGGAEVSAAHGQTAIPIVEEELVVGKREVDRGGVRVYSHVVEHPVEADVLLRDEAILVERRFVDRPATAADFAAGSGNVIELIATGEEAVVGKTSRVVEEVLVGKQSSQHTEEVYDTLRKTEVDVEEIPAETVGAGYGKSTDDRY